MRSLLPASLAVLLLAGLCGTATAGVEPTPFINYQGVLRDSGGHPLEGGYDMAFRFFDAASGGNECLVDEHRAAGTGDVEVAAGMFSARLGGGQLSDGAGPGTYGNLAEVFRDYAEVYLEVEVWNAGDTTWETLSPRVRVLSAAYALNADHLDGNDSAFFLNTSSADQTKQGRLFLESPVAYGMQSSGPAGGGYFLDSDSSGYAYIGSGNYGLRGYGTFTGGYFHDSDGSGRAYVAYGDVGIQAWGLTAGGYFYDSAATGLAYVGVGHRGIEAQGDGGGGYFLDSNGSGECYVADGDTGIRCYGNSAGGEFEDGNSSGHSWVGHGDDGIYATGRRSGGLFEESDGSGYTYVAYNNQGIWAQGYSLGGFFQDGDDSGYARVGNGDQGISAHGDSAGGYFTDTNSDAVAYTAYSVYGILARGNTAGGYFYDYENSGRAYVAYGERGIWAKGTFAGGTFSHPDDLTFWADVSTSTRKIIGTGTVSFVQNHPFDPGQVIVYAAPEGDEVATYTRGSARLAAGEARVPLGETFRWVTNPDIGLTAHLTPRGEWADLYVVSVTTSELVVRSLDAGSEAAFDYVVYGLRLGFEEAAVVQRKEREAFLPTAEAIQSAYEDSPELRAHNAIERFGAMRAELGEGGEIDLSGSRALVTALEGQRAVAMARLAEMPEPPEEEIARAVTSAEPGPEGSGAIRPEVPGTPDSAPFAGTVAARASGGGEDPPAAPPFELLPASGTVRPGDVLVLDEARPGAVHTAAREMDHGVLGCAVAPGESFDLPTAHAAVGVSGIVLCRVDATSGAIGVGDLLTTSGNPGHAMVAGEYARGAVLGKAVESLEEGSGLIRVLVNPR